MRLYAGQATEFIHLNKRNQLAGFMETAFLQKMGRAPSKQEVMSWRNSLNRMADVFQTSGFDDQGVMVEYQLPTNSQRLDCLVFGHDDAGKRNTIVIELKQWERAELSVYDSDKVLTWVAGGNREVLHPAVQVGGYCNYLRQNLTAFYEGDPIGLEACSYLHNYNYDASDPLFDPRFKTYTDEFPVYTLEDYDALSNYLIARVGEGKGEPIMKQVEGSKYRPSPKLMKQVSEVIKKKLKGEFKVIGAHEDYILLDEQVIAYDTVLSLIKRGLGSHEKHAVIIQGGPGTGKSVIALKLLADLSAMKKHAEYATGSSSFTQTLRKLVGAESKRFFNYFMSYGATKPGSIDVLIMDEAHRIREKTGYPFKATGNPQVEDLLKACKVGVFLLDDLQVVRPKEIGRSAFIKEHAESMGCVVHEIKLETQFRCAGSEAFISWVDHMLHVGITAHPEWVPDPNFDFQIFPDPQSMEDAIRAKVADGATGRMMAGYCWPWSEKPLADGSLEEDVVIGEYRRPWNARPESTGLKTGIPKSHYWAYEPGGIDQVGCIYTAQGFEFDYAGIIIGKDMVYDFATNAWKGQPEHCHDGLVKGSRKFLDLVKNTYRVLLTRGQKGCYVCFLDKDTENYFRSRVRRSAQ